MPGRIVEKYEQVPVTQEERKIIDLETFIYGLSSIIMLTHDVQQLTGLSWSLLT